MSQLKRILIANRGEIAVRIMRTCREMGIDTVAVYTPDDERSVHVMSADDAVSLPDDGYLDAAAIVGAAAESGADAVHPGYGFLAEDPALGALCEQRGIVLIGPPPAVVEVMADKARARHSAIEAGLPVLPAIERNIDADEIARFGASAGWPLIIKAVGGGGGRGARVVSDADGVATALEEATAESARLFASADVLVERYLPHARHIEVQVLADRNNTAHALGTRDCSIQRRRQKVLEEAPAVGLAPEVEEALLRGAVELAAAVGYRGVGTVEYLVDGADFYFLEMNTRIQVEHPVTEEVYGVDLVRAQIEIAAGEPLSASLLKAQPRGHAIELRINAEDPDAGFTPSAGMLSALEFPRVPGVRVDAGYREGDSVSGRYDGLVAKLIAWAPDRRTALDRLDAAIADTTVQGVRTTLELGRFLLSDPELREGPVHTRWLEESLMSRFTERHSPNGSDPTGAAPDAPGPMPSDQAYGVWIAGRFHRMAVSSERRDARLRTVSRHVESATGSAATRRAEDLEIRSPMQGTVTEVLVTAGQNVAAGESAISLEAMKLENRVRTETDGIVSEVLVSVGDVVQTGQLLVRLADPAEG